MKHSHPESNVDQKPAGTGLRRRSTRLTSAAVGLAATGALALGVGATSTAEAAQAANDGCIVTSNGFTYNCETGILSWDNTVTISGPNDEAALFDASTKPQKLVAGPIHLPHGPGPGSALLGTFKCGPFQFDIQAPGSNFIAGHKGTNGPCVETTTTTATTTTATTSTTTTSGALPATATKTAATSGVLGATYSLAPVNAGVEAAPAESSSISAGQALLALLVLVALWIAGGTPRPRVDRTGGPLHRS